MKVLAFYLPQFHTFPENDLWWGKGFTEWTNTKKSVPNFKGHYQPHTPLGQNYYDLEKDPDIISSQVVMAKKYGIDGFCFYHYWFANGKKLMEKPIEKVLEDSSLDISFCLCWANENWSRRWDGSDCQILIEQDYGNKQGMVNHFYYVKKFFDDKRYIRDDKGRPVFIIYKPQLISNLDDLMNLWNVLAIQEGFSGICFVCQFPQVDTKIESKFAYHIDFEPIATTGYVSSNFVQSLKNNPIYTFEVIFSKIMQSIGVRSYKKYSYKNAIEASIKRKMDKKTWLGAFPGWDNTARRGKNAIIYDKGAPELFEYYVKSQLQKSISVGQEGIVFVNAWNEWAEGAHLEPDEKFKYAYLQALYRARCSIEDARMNINTKNAFNEKH